MLLAEVWTREIVIGSDAGALAVPRGRHPGASADRSRWTGDPPGALRVRERAAPYGAESASDMDELLLLGERCAATYMRSDALQHEAMVLLAEYDERAGWRHTAFTSTAEWLAWRIGITPGAARERVRTARALKELPRTAAAMRDGELSFTKVRALTRVARPESEEALLEFARSCSAARLECRLRSWTSSSRADDARAERRRHDSRDLSVFPDEDGMYVVRGRLDPEVGAVLMRAIEAASDALYLAEGRESAKAGASAPVASKGDETTPGQRRADALGLVAERALAAGFEEGPVSGSRAERYQVVLHVEERTLRSEGAGVGGRRVATHHSATRDTATDVSAETSRRAGVEAKPRSTSRFADGVGVSAETHGPGAEAGPQPLSRFADGVRVSAETSRRLACDAALVCVTRGPDEAEGRSRVTRGPDEAEGRLRVTRGPDEAEGGARASGRRRAGPGLQAPPGLFPAIGWGPVLDAGRRTRTIPPALRRALEVRDGGCRHPGCGSRFTDAHHIQHWADGGPTRLDNLVLLCRRHHRAVHEGRVRVCRGADGALAFFGPDGGVLYDAPPRGRSAMVEGAPDHGAEPRLDLPSHRIGVEPRLDLPSHRTGAARWARDRDVPWGVEVRALEAIESAAEG